MWARPSASRVVAVLMALVVLAAQLPAAAAPDESAIRDQVLWLMGPIRAGDSVDEVRQRLVRQFLSEDVDGHGISASDRTATSRIRAATQRAGLIERWLRHDLDGDGSVTEAEARRSLGAEARRAPDDLETSETERMARLERLVADLALPDPNGDGRSSTAEIAAAARAQIPPAGTGEPVADSPFDPWFDRDGDGVVRLAEMLETLDRTLFEFDRDFDGRFSVWEVSLHRAAAIPAKKRVAARHTLDRRRRALERQVAACAIPSPPAAEEFLVLSLLKGGAVTDLWVGGRRPAMRLVEVTIAEGEPRLVLLALTPDPTVFRLTGATGRLSRVVVANPDSAVVGAASGGARWLNADCRLSRLPRGKRLSAEDRELVARAAGRTPTKVFELNSAVRIELPEGNVGPSRLLPDAVLPEASGAAARLWQRFLRDHPGGLVHVEPDSVSAPGAVGRHAVPPGEAGLATLVAEGALEPEFPIREERVLEPAPDGTLDVGGISLGPGSAETVTVDGIAYRRGVDGLWYGRPPQRFIVRRRTTLPADIDGEMRVEIRLAPGVPRPEGLLAPARIID